jgi:hypothetical protein
MSNLSSMKNFPPGAAIVVVCSCQGLGVLEMVLVGEKKLTEI